MQRLTIQGAAIVAAAVCLYVTGEARAQTDIDPCTGQSASPVIEQQYLNALENGLKRLSDGNSAAGLEVQGVLDYANNFIISVRQKALIGTILSGRAVERIMEPVSGVVRTKPTLLTSWARFRLALANSLLTADCLDEAEQLLAGARAWPIDDPDVVDAVIGSHAGILSELGRLREAVATLRPFLDDNEPLRSFTALRVRAATLNNLGKALRQNGQRTQARRLYHRAPHPGPGPKEHSPYRDPGRPPDARVASWSGISEPRGVGPPQPGYR